MKKYFVKRGDFGNQYELMYTENTGEENQAITLGFSRITRKEAESLCREERQRRKHNPSFAYYADSYIYPAAAYSEEYCLRGEVLTGYLVKYKHIRKRNTH